MPLRKKLRKRDRDDEESVDSSKLLLRKAFKLGFEIGYRGHRENLGWVRRFIDELQTEAKKNNLIDETEKYYLRGKEIGRRRRSQKMALGEPISAIAEELPTEAKSYELRMFGPIDERTLSSTPQVIESPQILDPPRATKAPTLLRLSRLFRSS